MLSNSSKYAIKAVLFLAVNSNKNKRIMVKDMAEPINAPQAYLAKLLQELSRKDVISSVKGPKGGFYLSEENLELSLMDVVNVIEGDNRFHTCVLSLEKCNADKPCPLHNLISPSKSKFNESLNQKTIKFFSEQIEKGIAFLPL